MNKHFKLLLVFVFILPISIKAQDVGFGHTKSFFRSKDFKVAASLGVETSFATDKGKGIVMSPSGTIDKDDIAFAKGMNNLSMGLGIDFYSSFSTLGFYIEPTYNIQEYSIGHKAITSAKDSIKTQNIEIPIYAKLRFGKPESKGHTWLALGAGYSFIGKTTTKTMKNGVEINNFDSKKQFKSVPYLSAILGYELIVPLSEANGREVYNRDDFRILFFIKGNYDLGNRFDDTNSYKNNVLATHYKPELKLFRATIGIKAFYRFGKLGKMTTEALQESLTK